MATLLNFITRPFRRPVTSTTNSPSIPDGSLPTQAGGKSDCWIELAEKQRAAMEETLLPLSKSTAKVLHKLDRIEWKIDHYLADRRPVDQGTA